MQNGDSGSFFVVLSHVVEGGPPTQGVWTIVPAVLMVVVRTPPILGETTGVAVTVGVTCVVPPVGVLVGVPPAGAPNGMPVVDIFWT